MCDTGGSPAQGAGHVHSHSGTVALEAVMDRLGDPRGAAALLALIDHADALLALAHGRAPAGTPMPEPVPADIAGTLRALADPEVQRGLRMLAETAAGLARAVPAGP